MLHSVIRPSGSVMLTWSLTRLHSKGARTLCSKLRPRYPEKLGKVYMQTAEGDGEDEENYDERSRRGAGD